MRNEDLVKIPPSILKNPIHEVRPLVVNLYYKKPNPGVGTYDPIHPDEISKILDDPTRKNFKSVFESKGERFNNEFLVGDKQIVLNKNRMHDFYEVEKCNESMNRVKTSMPDSAFA